MGFEEPHIAWLKKNGEKPDFSAVRTEEGVCNNPYERKKCVSIREHNEYRTVMQKKTATPSGTIDEYTSYQMDFENSCTAAANATQKLNTFGCLMLQFFTAIAFVVACTLVSRLASASADLQVSALLFIWSTLLLLFFSILGAGTILMGGVCPLQYIYANISQAYPLCLFIALYVLRTF